MPMNFHLLIFSRIKLLAGMDIPVSRRPQDGHTHTTPTVIALLTLEFPLCRVNLGKNWCCGFWITPVQHKLEALGFFKNDLKMLYQASQAPNGLILMVGPTGSGKTTTLYAILNALNSQEKIYLQSKILLNII